MGIVQLDIPKPSRNCSVSGRELLPGEDFFSVLVEEAEETKRVDFAAEHWDEPSGDTLPDRWVGWWKTTVPILKEKKAKLAPNEILLNLFEQLRAQPEQVDMLYVLTLLLIRRRLFRYEREEESTQNEKQLVVYSIKENTTYEVPVVMPDQARMEEIQEQLAELLYN